MSVFRRDVAEALRSEGASDPGSLDMMSWRWPWERSTGNKPTRKVWGPCSVVG